jgi:hypothetical protein
MKTLLIFAVLVLLTPVATAADSPPCQGHDSRTVWSPSGYFSGLSAATGCGAVHAHQTIERPVAVGPAPVCQCSSACACGAVCDCAYNAWAGIPLCNPKCDCDTPAKPISKAGCTCGLMAVLAADPTAPPQNMLQQQLDNHEQRLQALEAKTIHMPMPARVSNSEVRSVPVPTGAAKAKRMVQVCETDPFTGVKSCRLVEADDNSTAGPIVNPNWSTAAVTTGQVMYTSSSPAAVSREVRGGPIRRLFGRGRSQSGGGCASCGN